MIQEEKRRLRIDAIKARDGIQNRAALDRLLTARFVDTALYGEAASLLLYMSFRSEAGTHALIARALSDGKHVYLPRCVPHTSDMEFYRIQGLADLASGGFGLLEPDVSRGLDLLEAIPPHAVCLVPGLAFTASGVRLGWGRGYYDRYLVRKSICTVGYCYDEQILDFIPAAPEDRPMDFILTPTRLIDCKPQRKGSFV